MTTSDLAQPTWLPLVVGLSICGLALWKGEWPERVIATAYLFGWGATELLTDRSFPHIQWTTLALDILALAVALLVAFRSNRLWVLWVAGFRILAVVTHIARLLDPKVGGWAYITAGVMWGYLVLIALAVGVWGSVRRKTLSAADMHDQ